ncbi:MAG: aminotransferase class I/II-fold pyridoxal phosphate-dependent enzyme [Oscillospiraceae bacterium]|nr:aminotransferase class I/II-fold pyridoxal phosphate-dependent enzyme [Oscillospiraceae bacterium]MDD4368222.1 aminotransferase class I/II-fold pyridoxal phosphate-dependent enzyme [Oscillospiraceae bacterium]
MSFDFTTILDRHGKDAIAVDGIGHGTAPGAPKDGFDAIPMWVADMNFPTAPSIQLALQARIEHPAYGYFSPPRAYYEAISWWQQTRNKVSGIRPADISYANGVLGGVISALNVLCSKGDKVLLHAPTYVGFTHALENNGYKIIHSQLQPDAQGCWRMDFADMAQKLAQEHIHAAIFCSPHNPCGRVWERWEIEQAMSVFREHNVYVISDEIWSDLTLNEHQHIPTQSVSPDARQRTTALYAPSKTFNLAGLVGSYQITYNSWLRDRINKEASLSHCNSMNVLSMHALMGAYSPEGAAWVDALREVLSGNVTYACDYIAQHFNGVRVFPAEGTYMLFLDCTEWCATHHRSINDLLSAGWDVGVAWQDGTAFHGPCHIRMNLALPLSRVQEAFRRLDEYVFSQ